MAEMPRFDRVMSDAEGLMWRLEKDPHLSSTFANITILDKSPDVAALMRRLERATWAIPRLRQRVQASPMNLMPPAWVDDPHFDLAYHVRHIALPKPGTMRQLLDLACLLTNDAFDRNRPLWQFVVVDGLRGGKSALIEKLHHAIVDGEGGIQLSMQFLDLERDAPEPPPLDLELIERANGDSDDPPPADVWRDLVAGSLRFPLAVLRQVRDLVADPAGLPSAGSAAADTVRAMVQQLSEVDGARSPLWTSRSLHRRVDVLRVGFEPTRAAAKRLGGTLNVAFLTAAAQAAGDYHQRLGRPVGELRASMAYSTRTDDSGANAFGLARMLVPTAAMPIDERFAAVAEAAESGRNASASANLEAIAALSTTLPTSLVTRLARQQAQTVDFATSNVRAAPIPLYVAGARILHNYPVGPLGGVAFNLTLLSYDGHLDMGVHVDTKAVAEPDLLVDCLTSAFRTLHKA